MIFNDYINESLKRETDILFDALKKDVPRRFLNLVGHEEFLFKQTLEEIPRFKKKSGVGSLRTYNYTREVYDTIDDYFEESYGWRLFEHGIAVYGNRLQLNPLKSRLFFPIGEYKFLWSTTVPDIQSLNNIVGHLNEYMETSSEREVKYFLSKHMGIFTDSNLMSAMTSGKVIFFKTERGYYLTNTKYRDKLQQLILSGG